jgi:hypothetical protein
VFVVKLVPIAGAKGKATADHLAQEQARGVEIAAFLGCDGRSSHLFGREVGSDAHPHLRAKKPLKLACPKEGFSRKIEEAKLEAFFSWNEQYFFGSKMADNQAVAMADGEGME